MCSVVGIFFLVKTRGDVIWAALLQSLPNLIAGLISWFILMKKFPETLRFSCWQDIKKTLVDSWDIFTSTVAINVYTASNIVILGFMTNPTVVGYFSGAYKIIQCVQRLMSPISDAIYPHISKEIEQDKVAAVSFIRKIAFLLGGGMLILSLMLFIFAAPIIRLLMGPDYGESVAMLRIISFLPFIISLSNVFGIQTMLPFGLQREFSRTLIASAVLNTIIIFPFIYFCGGNGVCWSMLVTECFVTSTMWIVLKRKHIFKQN